MVERQTAPERVENHSSSKEPTRAALMAIARLLGRLAGRSVTRPNPPAQADFSNTREASND